MRDKDTSALKCFNILIYWDTKKAFDQCEISTHSNVLISRIEELS